VGQLALSLGARPRKASRPSLGIVSAIGGPVRTGAAACWTATCAPTPSLTPAFPADHWWILPGA